MRSFFTLTALVSAILFLLPSCKKECEVKAPVISITTPVSGGIIQLPDSVHISGTISDDVWLNSATVMIHNQNEDTIFISHPHVYGEKTFTFAYNYFTATSGLFHLHITAKDNDGLTAEKEIVFTILP
jgi:hypothetical protein